MSRARDGVAQKVDDPLRDGAFRIEVGIANGQLHAGAVVI